MCRGRANSNLCVIAVDLNKLTNNYMKKSLFFFSLFVLIQTINVFAQNIELPIKQYLCDTGSVDLDGTVVNTTDPGITYQWYYYSGTYQVITGATNPIYSATTANMGNGFYKVIATMSDTSTISDVVQVIGVVDVPTWEDVQCIEFYTTSDLFNTYNLLYDVSNVIYTYHYTLNDANSGINSIANWETISYAWQLYLRIEESNGGCIDVITLNVNQWSITYYANSVSNMGSCSSDSTNNAFDLTTNDTQIIGGQTPAVVSYFTDYNDAWNLTNPISNPTNYTAVSPNQTIYARLYDPNNPNMFCEVYASIIQFQLLSAPEPTPNTTVNYIVCDNTSGTANDNIGAFDLTSKNSLVLAGLSSSQFGISYHNTISDAQNDINPIASPTNYIATTGEVVYTRVESNAYVDCTQISLLNLFVQDTCDDIEVSLVSYWGAPSPGFTYRNRLIIKNKGESTVSAGSVMFEKDDQLVYNNATGVSAGNTVTPTAVGFGLDFVNLTAGAQEEILIEMTVPVSAVLGNIVTNTAAYITNASDVNEENDTATLSEVILGSYDPNDIMESRGPEIVHSAFTNEDYLYYTVRFQNVGTASAVNITIDNALDAKLDKTTFEMLHSSHTNTVERVFDKLNWQFDNINLADATNDEPNSHGYVYYRIKPLAGYSVGDIVPNTASIVFDFNAPVITNTFNTEFVAALGVEEVYSEIPFLMMPNPARDNIQLSFRSNEPTIEVTIYDILGKLVLVKTDQNVSNTSVDVSVLNSGVYFVKIKDAKGQFGLKKLVKE